ncbi:hypothetical protein M569_02257, partial [Genlisea aurea]
MEDEELEFLSRVAANHLLLGQFEPFRAIILSLRARNPDLARTILQTVVSNGGRVGFPDPVLWSDSCPSPALLTFLCTQELLHFPDPTSSCWSFDPNTLKLRAEFLLYVHIISSRVLEKSEYGGNIEVDGISDAGDAKYETLRILNCIMEVGFGRLRSDLIILRESTEQDLRSLGEGELMKLRGIIVQNSDIFDALCLNIREQLPEVENEDSSLALALRQEVRQREENEEKLLRSILKCVQVVHLDAIRGFLEKGDEDGATAHVRFLDVNCGIEETEYRVVLQDLLKRMLAGKCVNGDDSITVQQKVLSVYNEAVSSHCLRIVQILQLIQDSLLVQESDAHDISNQIPLPLWRLQNSFAELTPEMPSNEMLFSLKSMTSHCKRDFYHYSRVRGVHLFECLIDTALPLVQKGQIQEACQVLTLFPELQPLVAVLGWDLLINKTTMRRKLMQCLWISKSESLSSEEISPYEDKSEEKMSGKVSCIELLCDTLCYHLDVALFVACKTFGQPWSRKSSLLLSGKEFTEYGDVEARFDPFVENLVLERLSVQSPLRIIFDLVPRIKYQDVMEVLSLQPITSTAAAHMRMQDIELIHMRYALEHAVIALVAMEENSTDGTEIQQRSLSYLKEMKSHLDAMNDTSRKIYLVNIIISLLYMDSLHVDFSPYDSTVISSNSYDSRGVKTDLPSHEYSYEMLASFIGQFLNILKEQLPSSVSDSESSKSIVAGSKQAVEWRLSKAKCLIDEWEWRLSVLLRLFPLSEQHWKWKEALVVLRAAPSKLLNLCMQRAKYDIGEETISRFSLSQENKAMLQLTEWVDGAFRKASVEDVRSHASGGSSCDLDFFTLRSQLHPLAAIILFIDVAAAYSKSPNVSLTLLNQAQVLLSEIYPGGKMKDSNYWDQIHEMAIISTVKRVLRCLFDLLEQGQPLALPDLILGETVFPSWKESRRHGNRDRALILLNQMIEDAHMGKRQFLSGKLHNLARAIADEETDRNHADAAIRDGSFYDVRSIQGVDVNGVLGLGFRPLKEVSTTLEAGESGATSASYDVHDTKKALFRPLGFKITTFLSQFILHIAAIGDIVDGTDSTDDFNYFSLVYEYPKDLLTRLVFDRGSTDAAGKAAEIMNLDFVHEVISACVPPVYPPRSGHGWASVPVVRTLPKTSARGKIALPAREAKPKFCIHSGIPGVPLYPLNLDVVKHLVKLSSVRAVLACVFGSSMFYRGSDPAISNALYNDLLPAPDVDRSFYEFALDQSERYPALNRWIQMQTNLHRVFEVAITKIHGLNDSEDESEATVKMKRVHESESETDSENENVEVLSAISSPTPDLKEKHYVSSEAWDKSPETVFVENDNTAFLSFDWENEGLYEKGIERLIDEGRLSEAYALSDRVLRNGASDRLLHLLIVHEESDTSSELPQIPSGHHIWSNSWQYCQRLKDKQLAAKLALKYLHKWDLQPALDILTMCICHLQAGTPLKTEVVVERRQALYRYKRILSADDLYSSWQEVEHDFKEDPEGLALKLAEKGAVSHALEVAESSGLSVDLRRELQGRQLVKLLAADPVDGGGPAEASRFLSFFRDSDDGLPVAISAMQLLPDLRSKQLLVHFFLKRSGNLTDVEVSRLNSWALGLRVLASLPLPWQQRCSSLHEHPQLILEVLLMRKQLQSASQILKEFPSLGDNGMILLYASKAIAVSLSSPARETRISVYGPKQKPRMKTSAPTRPSFSNSLSHLQKEARRAFTWAPRNPGDKGAAATDTRRKRKSSGLTQTEKVSWRTSESQEDRASVCSTEGQERFPALSIAAEWMLTGDLEKDEVVRSTHRYDTAPDIILFKGLLSLCSDEMASGKGALDLCVNQMKNVLSSQQLPQNVSMETIGRAYHATETFVQGLLFAKSKLRKLAGTSDSGNSEKGRDTDDTSSDAGSSSLGSQSTDELSEALSHVDVWLRRAELLQSLLGSGIACSLDDVADTESSARLRDRLIQEERYSMAVYTCKKCKIEAFPVWYSWGHALLQMDHYAQARVKFKQALQLHKGDVGPLILEIINTIEGSTPVDVSSVRSMYDYMMKSEPSAVDYPLSADSYLEVLYMPSVSPRSERSRRFLEPSSSSLSSDLEDVFGSNLDNIRYLECLNYLQEYARQHVLGFLFRHGRYKEACLLFLPADPVPQQSSVSSASPQRSDPLASDYGTIDDLCEFCVGYGAMAVLEEVILLRMENIYDELVTQHTAAAVNRICLYCESHKHFNYLYKFLVIKRDHVAAGLCCIQLFMNSASQDLALKHLENSKLHFDEGLSARYKGGDSEKLVSKSMRGKSASERLTEEGLVKFTSRVSIQIDIVKTFNDVEGPQWKHSIFGNPSDPETFRRRCKIAETLAEKNFDLAFRIIYEFNLPAVDIYAGVAASLAERKKGGQLTEVLKNIKGTIDDDDWDQVLGAAINVYANKHKERPDRLIDMLTSSHRKVLACVVCGRLKSAFQIASRSGSVADVQYVAHQ